tara:strand:+ start:449 stop:673 length:225 start_codon:yes stop_codon:yes gene_type:complete
MDEYRPPQVSAGAPATRNWDLATCAATLAALLNVVANREPDMVARVTNFMMGTIVPIFVYNSFGTIRLNTAVST